jgi:hypothetical protein
MQGRLGHALNGQISAESAKRLLAHCVLARLEMDCLAEGDVITLSEETVSLPGQLRDAWPQHCTLAKADGCERLEDFRRLSLGARCTKSCADDASYFFFSTGRPFLLSKTS